MNLCYDTEAKNPYEHVSLVSNSFFSFATAPV